MDNDSQENQKLNKLVNFLLLRSENKEKQSAHRLFLKLSMFLGTAIGAAKGMLDVSHLQINNIDSLEKGALLLVAPILTFAISTLPQTYLYVALTDFLDKKDKQREPLLINDNKVLQKIVPMMKQMLHERNEMLKFSPNNELTEENKQQLKDNFFEKFKTVSSELQEKNSIKNMNYTIHKIFKNIVAKEELEKFDLKTEIKKTQHKM